MIYLVFSQLFPENTAPTLTLSIKPRSSFGSMTLKDTSIYSEKDFIRQPDCSRVQAPPPSRHGTVLVTKSMRTAGSTGSGEHHRPAS
jgi:hypothetical protein